MRSAAAAGKQDYPFSDGVSGDPEAKNAAILEKRDERIPERGQWGRQLDFLLSCLGYTVGVSNIWRFPYLCMRNGGGAFLIPYFLCMFLCGMPMYFLELIIGQFSSCSPLKIWNICPLFKGIGWGMVIVSGILSLSYNLVVTWALYYLGKSFTKQLPWATCNNHWNTLFCAERSGGNSTTNSQMVATNITANSSTFRTPAEEFWQFEMLQLTDGIDNLGGIRWELLLCLFAAWLLVFLCLFRGIKTSGKVVYVTATVPYLFLTILLIRGLLLPGAMDGIAFYLTPDFGRLLEFTVWAEACVQIFYSLGPAWGALITLSSYNKFNNNCLRDAVIVCFCCAGTSFFAGLVIFSLIGSMAVEAGLSVDDVITSGPGLAFIAYPEAIARLPLAPVWSILFFLMIIFLGLDSQFSTFETTISGCVDQFPKHLQKRKTLFTAFICGFEFILSIMFVSKGGLYYFQILDWYAGAFCAMVIALLECVVLAWIYGTGRLFDDAELMLGGRPSVWWKICWGVITPIMLMIITVFSFFYMSEPNYGDYVYPRWAIVLGWSVGMVSVVPIPLMMVTTVWKEEGPLLQRIRKLLRPSPDWGPALQKHRSLYKYATPTHQVESLVKNEHVLEAERN